MGKKVFIHVGPPKTGSSAIQNFMLENPAFRKKAGIMYPRHTLTASGVSAGNLRAIYDISRRGKPSLSAKKISSLLEEFEKSDARILLLSSENFFGPMPMLAEAIPQARFILYLRNPLTLAESLYNQDVKNNGRCTPFEIKNMGPHFENIYHIKAVSQRIGRHRLLIRFFHPQLFYKGNIVNDLLDAMGIQLSEEIPESRVNLSYTLPALEVKRFLNHYKLSSYCDYILNNLLQQYHEGTAKYSFLKPGDFKKHLTQVENMLHLFFEEIPCADASKFLETIQQTQQKKYVRQEITEAEFAEVRDYIFNQNKPLYYELCAKLTRQQGEHLSQKWKLALFTERIHHRPATILFRLLYRVNKSIFINKLRLAKLRFWS